MFGDLYKNAVVRNLTIKATVTQNYDNRFKAVLAASIYDTGVTVENLTVIYEGGTDSSDVYGGGFITRSESKSATFKNLVVKAAGKKIGSLFGTKLNNVTFENCSVIADEVNCLAAQFKDGAVVEGSRVEINSVSETEIKFILGSQEVLLTAETKAIDLKGLDNGRTVTDIKVGEVSLGNTPSALTIPDTFKNDLTLHGKRAVTVTFDDGTAVDMGVTFVTAEISTEEEFINAIQIPNTTDIATKYGYYVLKNNVTFNHNVNGYPASTEADANVGFRGTLDGKTFALTTPNTVYNGGFFGLLGTGAVVKNLKISVAAVNNDALGVIAAQAHGAKIEKVELTLAAAPNNEYGGILFGRNSGTVTCSGVTINAAGLDIVNVFGVNLGWGQLPTCKNVVLKAKSLGVVGKKGWSGDPIASLDGFTFIETLAE